MFPHQTGQEYRMMTGTDIRIQRDPLAIMQMTEDQIKQSIDFHGTKVFTKYLFPLKKRRLLYKGQRQTSIVFKDGFQHVVGIEAMEKFKGKSNDINPFSHLAPLPALKDDHISIIGVHREGGSGKTALVTEVGKKAEELDMFDKVISITVSRTPNIRDIQGKIADMLNMRLGEESEEGRAQRLWLCLQEKK
ncbi:hypothetical protein KIW84_054897 [Lathyrus oleraceus]|uniref:NB-ARC domain-containing protein n=1 Tax=Pisum sativum TaxID=3888 RepID=A0A9D4WWV7_PEA|nr:hypothetical protein KIW84_054897 [Pisum sativum]